MQLQDTILESANKGCRIQIRYVVSVLSFLGVVLSTAAKSFMGAAIVAMVKSENGSSSNRNESSLTDGTCPANGKESDVQTELGEFSWSEVLKGYILSSFFYGYLCTQLLGGYLSNRFGPRFVTGICNLIAGVSVLVGPLAARYSVYYFITARAFAGLASGAVVPSILALFPKWFHHDEQHMMTNFVFIGLYFGSFVGLGLTGLLIRGGQWPLPFYFWGGMLILWSTVWIFFTFNTPKDHPLISRRELNYLESSFKGSKESNTTEFNVPWCSIFTSVPVWAWIGYQISVMWVVYTLITEMPSYLHIILHFDAQMSGLLSAIPSLIGGVGGFIYAAIAQWIRRRKFLSQFNSYRLFNGIECGGVLVCLISITLLGCNATAIVTFFMIMSFTSSATVAGSAVVNNLDLAANYAGVLIGIQHTLSHATGIVVPLVVGYLTQNNQTLTQWNKVFYIGVGLKVVMYFFYICFGSTDEQPWNEIKIENPRETESSKKRTAKRQSDKLNVSTVSHVSGNVI